MATKDKAALLIERVNLRSLALSLLIVALGFFLIYCSEDGEWWKEHDVLQGTVREVGKLLLATSNFGDRMGYIWKESIPR